jgi:flavin-dependent dehydrogenase
MLTPKAYSYLVCCEGAATLAAAAFTPQPGMKERLPRVIEGFHSRVEFEMCEPKYFAASIGFDWPRTAQQQGQLYVGEAAGFQDYVAGFGLRMGMTTGYLAARSMLEGCDYDELWRARYLPLMKAAAVNRFLLETFGNRGYPLVLCYLRRYPRSARAIVHRRYHPIFLTTSLWPLAKRFVEAKCRPRHLRSIN